MRKAHLVHLVCPECRQGLGWGTIETEAQDRVLAGNLICSGCRTSYPIIGGVPRFVPADNYAKGFGFQWNRHSKTQLDSHTGLPLSAQRFFTTTGWPRQMTGKIVLEVGSGAGRFTEAASSTGALIVSLDYSSAVEANFANNGHRENVLILQGDAYRMPVREGYFDGVFCLGVLQHTPDVHRTFQQLPKFLKPGGRLAVDLYRRLPAWKQATITKFWARPITRRMKPETLYRCVNRYIRMMWPLANWIHRLPYGRNLNWKLLIADYRDVHPLSEKLLLEWAILDTFDMLAPAYDQPQTQATLQSWFEEAKLTNIEVAHGYNGLDGRGTRPEH